MQANSNAMSGHQRGLLLTGLGGILFTLDIPLLRLAGGDHWALIFGRGICLFIAITAWWFLWYRMRGRRVPFINGKAGLIVACTNTLANIMFIAAVTLTTAANLVFILALVPIFCAIFAWLFLNERIHAWTWFAVFLSLTGVTIIVWDGLTTGTYIGDALGLGVALCTATALTVIRKTGKNVVTSLGVGSLASALVASIWAIPLLGAGEGLTTAGWGWVALNGLLVIPLASALIALGPRYLPAPEVAMFFLLDTVLTPIWIWMLFAELPTTYSMVGGALVILTLTVHSFWRYTSMPNQSVIELSAR